MATGHLPASAISWKPPARQLRLARQGYSRTTRDANQGAKAVFVISGVYCQYPKTHVLHVLLVLSLLVVMYLGEPFTYLPPSSSASPAPLPMTHQASKVTLGPPCQLCVLCVCVCVCGNELLSVPHLRGRLHLQHSSRPHIGTLRQAAESSGQCTPYLPAHLPASIPFTFQHTQHAASQ